MRQAYDFSPLYRSMIGVDRMADRIETAMRAEGDRSYPPYDIEKTSDDTYRITLAAAGFAETELEVIAQPNLLIVTGRKAAKEGERAYLHQGLRLLKATLVLVPLFLGGRALMLAMGAS